jgi:hypothetical protein
MSDPLDAITKMGQMFASSGMFGCTKLEQGQVLALACLVQGKDPFELMQNYYIINGSLSMKSVAVLANFMKSGGKVKWYSALNNSEPGRSGLRDRQQQTRCCGLHHRQRQARRSDRGTRTSTTGRCDRPTCCGLVSSPRPFA